MNTTKLSLIALALAIAPSACLLPKDQADNDDRWTYENPAGDDVGSSGTVEQEVRAEDVAPVVQGFSYGTGSVLGFASPIADGPDENANSDDPPPQGKGAQAQSHLENNKEGMLEDPSCASFRVENLAVEATFDNCTLKATGATLDGKAAIGISVLPLGLYVDFTNLTMGDRSADGYILIGVGGSWEDPQVLLGGDLRFADEQSDVSVALDKVSLYADENGAVLNGGCDIDKAADQYAVDMNAVRWAAGQCHPSSGSIDFYYGNTPVTVTFLADTPEDGIVEIQIGSLPATEQQVLEPCTTN